MFGQEITISDAQEKACEKKCANYGELQDHIMDFSEKDLLRCIHVEKDGRQRFNILNRLYARFSEVRKHRERRELLL